MPHRTYLKAQMDQYLKHVRESPHNHMFSPYYGGIVQQERLPVPALNLEPSSLYVGNPKMVYPKSLIKDVQRTRPRIKGGAFSFDDFTHGVEDVYNHIPAPIKDAATHAAMAALMGAGRKKPRRKGGAFSFDDFTRGAENVYNHIPAPIKDVATHAAMAALMGAGRKKTRKPRKRAGAFDFNDFVHGAKDIYNHMPIKNPLIDNALSMMGAGRKKTRKPNMRGEIVKKVMREKHLNLAQASSYVKQNNLY